MFFVLPKKEKLIHLGLTGLLLFGLVQPAIFPSKAQAVAASGYIRTDRMAASQSTGGTICTTPQTVGTEGKVVVTFPATGATADATHYGVNQTAANWTVTTTNLPSGSTAWPGIGTATAVSGGAVTFPSSDLTAGTQYCFNFSGTSTLSTPTAAASSLTGTIITQTSGASAIDTVNFALVAISNDQIAVSATVPSTFTFALSGNTAALSTLSTSAVTSATGITATINTNANNGWITWVKSANAALTSAGASDSISSPGTSNATPESLGAQAGYVLDTDLTTDAASGGTVTVDAEYNGTDTNSGGHLATTFQSVASANGPAGGDVITLVVRAKAGSLNKAASDYADTLTVTAAGQF